MPSIEKNRKIALCIRGQVSVAMSNGIYVGKVL